MLQTKFILFAAVALMVVGSAVAIIGGQDAARGQFPYFAYLETYKIHRIDFLLIKPLVILWHWSFNLKKTLIIQCRLTSLSNLQ